MASNSSVMTKDRFRYFWALLKTMLAGKVDAESGKGLSTNDYTTAEKNKLTNIAEYANNYSLPTASASVKGGVMVGTGLAITDGVLSATGTSVAEASASSAGTMSAAHFVKLEALPTADTLASTYATKQEITGVYKYKGSVASAANLPSSGQETGDVYNIESTSIYGAAGANVAWNGSAWDPLGEIFTIEEMTNSDIDSILAT